MTHRASAYEDFPKIVFALGNYSEPWAFCQCRQVDMFSKESRLTLMTRRESRCILRFLA